LVIDVDDNPAEVEDDVFDICRNHRKFLFDLLRN
jgi:hypothetical protein